MKNSEVESEIQKIECKIEEIKLGIKDLLSEQQKLEIQKKEFVHDKKYKDAKRVKAEIEENQKSVE